MKTDVTRAHRVSSTSTGLSCTTCLSPAGQLGDAEDLLPSLHRVHAAVFITIHSVQPSGPSLFPSQFLVIVQTPCIEWKDRGAGGNVGTGEGRRNLEEPIFGVCCPVTRNCESIHMWWNFRNIPFSFCLSKIFTFSPLINIKQWIKYICECFRAKERENTF